jgi:hypothetical protein
LAVACGTAGNSDHVYVLSPTETVIEAIAECGRIGVPVATILASGFGEAGVEGSAREQELRRISSETGLRIVGPSSLGVVNLHDRLLLTANAAFAEPDLPAGNIFVASHSGSMIGALVSRGLSRVSASPASSPSETSSIFPSAKSAWRRSMMPQSRLSAVFKRPSANLSSFVPFAYEAAERGKPGPGL